MAMDRVYDKLDELKAEMEKLKEECRSEKELSGSLRKAHNEQEVKFMEAKSLIERQVQQLNAKCEEISEARQTCENLKSSLYEKEEYVRHLNLVNEKLQVEYGEKIQKLEGENKVLGLALDETTSRTQVWERKISVANEDIEGLKRLLLIAQKKCLEAEEKAKASKELKQRDEVILKIEEENRNIQDQLKWKLEQFSHLEEAHKRLQDQFQFSQVEWEREKSELLQEICSLQTSLDSQTRIIERLDSQLKMCNQALSHEESRRKILEVEVFELRSHFENVNVECQEAKSRIENLTLQRDEDIATLRNALVTKETLFKEMEYRLSYLEQENQELKGSLKECQEAQIQNAGGNSLKKLQNKLRGLEQLHSQCSVNLKGKEAEWNSRLDKMKGDMNGCICDLKGKDNEIHELQMKLEDCHCLLEIQNEEMSVVVMVLKSEFFAAYKDLFNEKAEMEMCKKEKEREVYLEENREVLEQEKESLIGIVEMKDEKIGQLQQHVALLESTIAVKVEAIEALTQEKENCYRIAESKDRSADKLEYEISLLKQESVKRELEGAIHAGFHAQRTFEQEEERLLKLIKEKDQRTVGLCSHAMSLKQHLERAVMSSFVVVTEKQIEIGVLGEALEKAENLKKIEIQEKNEAIAEMEKKMKDSHEELKCREESMLHSDKQIAKLETVLEAQKSETERLKDQFWSKEEHLKNLIEKLHGEKNFLLEDMMKLSAERDALMVQMEGIYSWMSDFSGLDVELMDALEEILQKIDKKKGQTVDLARDGISISPSKSEQALLSFSTKFIEESMDKRSPLKALNH